MSQKEKMGLVTPYQRNWPDDFNQIRTYLQSGLTVPCSIEHIGSTAVPGLVAKPIIDLVIIVRRNAIKSVINQLGHLHYKHQGDLGITGRHAFDYLDPRIGLSLHHLYACEEGHEQIVKFLAFRDFLRISPVYREKLSHLKMKLNEEHSADRSAYIAGKNNLVSEITKLALEA